MGEFKFTGFLEVRPLEGVWESESASEKYAAHLLRRLSSDPGVLAVMRHRKWTAHILGEYDVTRDKKDLMNGNHVDCWGFHKTFRGGERHEIYVCLRNPRTEKQGNAHMSFVEYEDVKNTLFHELAHFVHAEHHDEFNALWKDLTDEAMAFELSFSDFKETIRAGIKSIVASNGASTVRQCLSSLSSIMGTYLSGLRVQPTAPQTDGSHDPLGRASTCNPEWSRVRASDPTVTSSIIASKKGRELLLAMGFEPRSEALEEVFVNSQPERFSLLGPWIQLTLDDAIKSIKIQDFVETESEQSQEIFRLPTTKERLAIRRAEFLVRQAKAPKANKDGQQLSSDIRELRRRQCAAAGVLDEDLFAPTPLSPPWLLEIEAQRLIAFLKWVVQVSNWKDVLAVLLPLVVYWATAEQRAQQQRRAQEQAAQWQIVSHGGGSVYIPADDHSNGPDTWKIVGACAAIYLLFVRNGPQEKKEPASLIKDDGSIRRELPAHELGCKRLPTSFGAEAMKAIDDLST
ncbi:hypothetical protein HKX48_001563 [Thoreauomyces humboldtii]|nr:hypothetical protein HKX48_001563 [Thoreauomyces humboldtii]